MEGICDIVKKVISYGKKRRIAGWYAESFDASEKTSLD